MPVRRSTADEGRARKKRVRQVERHRHQEGVNVVEIEGKFDKGDERPVQPGHEAEDEKQRADRDHGTKIVATFGLALGIEQHHETLPGRRVA
jgi:hypothetical protein